MPLLADKELVALIEQNMITTFKERPADWYDKHSPVQPASIDLTVGNIFIPEVKPNRRGGINKPEADSHTIMSGETALVETAEELSVPNDIAGFGFPPASLAVKGILMTNPGHIDPGFKGPLTFTLINMGKKPFTIRYGDILFTTLWMKLSCEVGKDYGSRNQVTVTDAKKRVDAIERDIDVLSKDFLSIGKRAKAAVWRSAFAATIIAAALSIGITWFGNMLSNSNATIKRVDDLEKSVAVLGTKLDERSIKKVIELETATGTLKSKMETVEKKLKITQ